LVFVLKFAQIKLCESALHGASEADGGHKEFLEILIASQEYSRFIEVLKNSYQS
jgi:hypothetical protein